MENARGLRLYRLLRFGERESYATDGTRQEIERITKPSQLGYTTLNGSI